MDIFGKLLLMYSTQREKEKGQETDGVFCGGLLVISFVFKFQQVGGYEGDMSN